MKRIPIFLKLIMCVLVVLSLTTAISSYKTSSYFKETSLQKEEHSNIGTAKAKSSEVEGVIRLYLEKLKNYSLFMIQNISDSSWQLFFEKTLAEDHDLVSLIIKENQNGKLINFKELYKDSLKETYKVDQKYLQNIELSQKLDFTAVLEGKIAIANISHVNGAPLVWIAMPFIRNAQGEYLFIASAYIRLEAIQKTFTEDGTRISYLVDSKGEIVSHPDESKVLNREYLNKIIFKKITEAQVRVGQFFNEETQKFYAYSKDRFGLYSVSEIEKGVIESPAIYAQKQSFFISTLILIASIFAITLFSSSFTHPIEKLLAFTHRIAHGDFDIDAGRQITQKDELGDLALAFDEMAVDLKEREKIKSVMNKFHGSTIAEELIRNEIGRGGSRKEAVIFFSDIRGFTSYSENRPPEEVVEMLNGYFDEMVAVVNKRNGVIDKFIGDAIMAVWGIPQKSETFAKDAIMACLEMRERLVVYNEKRIAEGKQEMMFGIGLHYGEVISGTIGSDDKLEYTVIGDAVNTAARIEASTKAFGADLLISEELVNLAGSDFIIDRAGVVEAKGKSTGLALYKVRGYKDENGIDRIVKTIYSDYEAGKADKIKVSA